MNNSNIQNKQQEILSMTVCALISYQPIVFFVNTVLNYFVDRGFIYDSLLLYIILLVLIIKSFLIIGKKLKSDILVISIIFMMGYLFSYLIFYNNRPYMFTRVFDMMGNPLYIFFVLSFSGYIITRHINNYLVFDRYLKLFSVSVIIVSIFTFFLLNKQGVQPQYMVFSYNMLIHTIYLFFNFLKHKKLTSGIISVCGIITIFVAGARGPIIISLFTILIYFIFMKKRIRFVLLLFILIPVYYNFGLILNWLSNFVSKYGINSRTIEKIKMNDFFDSSGRDLIYRQLIDNISFMGKGMYGDRAAIGTYAHNIAIELFMQYGYLFGIIIFTIILFIIACGVLSKDNLISSLCIIFISSGFLKLFLSGSYLNQEPCFYILLGLGVNSFCERKKTSNENSMVNQHNSTQNCYKFIRTSE